MPTTTLLRSLCLSLLGALPVVAAPAPPAPGHDDAPATVVLGTATPGGGFQLFGRHLAEVIEGADPSLRVEARATRGSGENLALLEGGAIDIGLVEGNAARRALDGVDRAPADLAVLWVMYPNPGMLVVRADSPYRHIEELRGRRIALGTRASGLRILAGDVLDGLTLSPERDFEPVLLDSAADGPRMLLSGEVEALWGAGIGWPGFVQVADSPAGARFLAPSAEQISAIRARHPHLRRMSVPAGTYTGQDERIDSVGLWSLVLARPDLPETLAHRLARALHRGEAELARRLAQGRYATAGSTAAEVPTARLHPGAARYLREVGLLP